MDRNNFTHTIGLRQIELTDGFWKEKTALIKRTVLPYQWEILNDRVEGAQPSYCMHNYRVAGKINEMKRHKADFRQPQHTVNGFCTWPEDSENPGDHFYGFVFQDSDFSKWIEAVAYSLYQYPDPELEKTADDAGLDGHRRQHYLSNVKMREFL